MTPLERLAEAYWNAFRDGYARVGGDPREYPLWSQSHDPIKQETLRCLRYAVETLKEHPWADRPVIGDTQDDFNDRIDQLFPEPLTKRSIKKTTTDTLMARRLEKVEYSRYDVTFEHPPVKE